jgi:MoaA/NifB/PqqE/SkfB family radical SAM enzyme
MTKAQPTPAIDDSAKKKLHNIKKRNRELLERERFEHKAVLRSLPGQIQIETTNRCALSCSSCARNYYDKSRNPPGDLDPDRFPELETLLTHAERVLFGGYGEPLLGKHTEKIMRAAATLGCFIEVITSGAGLDEKWIDLCRTMPVGRIICSVDAATEKGMLMRRGVGLARVLDALDKVEKSSPKTQRAFNVTLSIHNLDELISLVDIAARHEIQDIFVAHQKIYTRRQAGDSVLSAPDQAASVFNRCQAVAEEKGLRVHLPRLHGTHECMQPLELMMIRRDGLALACCSAVFGGGKPRIELGYLGERAILELWNSDQAVNARRRIYGLPHDPGPCDGCGFRVHTPEAMDRYFD